LRKAAGGITDLKSRFQRKRNEEGERGRTTGRKGTLVDDSDFDFAGAVRNVNGDIICMANDGDVDGARAYFQVGDF
jgi:hypothetical protein